MTSSWFTLSTQEKKLDGPSKSAVSWHCQPLRMAAMRGDQSDQHVLISTGALAGHNISPKHRLGSVATQLCLYSKGQSCQQHQHWQLSCTHHGSKQSNVSRFIANNLRLYTADYTLSCSVHRRTTLLLRDMSPQQLCNCLHQIRGQGKNEVTKRHSSDTGCCLSCTFS